MSKEETDYLLERFDQSTPAIQRGVTAKFVEMYATADARVRQLEDVLRGIATHGDDDHPCGHNLESTCEAMCIESMKEAARKALAD